MLIELREGMTLHPGTSYAVIAPGKVMISALNINTDLQRFLLLYVSGKYSCFLSSINRSFRNLRLISCLPYSKRRATRSSSLSTVKTLFEGAETMIPQITGMLKEICRELLVILYIPSIKRAFFRMDAGRPYHRDHHSYELSGTTLHCNLLYTPLWRSLSVYATDPGAT